MIAVADVLLIHNEAINRFGGAYGIRDQDALKPHWQGHSKALVERNSILQVLKKLLQLAKALL